MPEQYSDKGSSLCYAISFAVIDGRRVDAVPHADAANGKRATIADANLGLARRRRSR